MASNDRRLDVAIVVAIARRERQGATGRVLKLSSALMPLTSASAVLRGSAARCGNAAYTDGVLMTGLMVHGISASFCDCCVNCRVPLTVVRRASL